MDAWRRRGRMRAGAGCLCACLLAGCLLPGGGAAAAPDAEAQATLDRSVRFLQEAQNADGGFGGKVGAASDPLFTAWAAYALAAAGINPQDQAKPGGADVFSYLTAHTGKLKQTTDFDRVALVALAAGASPYSFGSVRPIEQILARQLPDGSFPQQDGGPSGWINSTAWSIFPLSAIDTPAAEVAVHKAAEWLLKQQQDGGSWGSTTAGSPADTDLTGAVVEALNAAGFHETEKQAEAFEYLHRMQGPDGGFRETRNTATNSATTAWVLQGMWSAGVDPRAPEWTASGGDDPLQFLASLQQADGSIKWTATDDLNALWMTAQVGPALAMAAAASS
jgi:Prenyltransferase and squalene oxidase repeat